MSAAQPPPPADQTAEQAARREAERAKAWGAQGDRSPLMNNYGSPLRLFVRGKGAQLWDRQGRRHLDFLCGLAVTGLGHAHPVVTEAVSDQAARLTHTSNLFANEHQAPVARTLDRLVNAVAAPGPADSRRGAAGQVLFQNSGAEAVEAAIKLARKASGRGRHVVVSALGSFHGRTLASLAATGQPSKHEPFQPMPEGFRHVVWDDPGELEKALSPDVGAVLLEPTQGEGGVNPASPGYLPAVAEMCAERGILLILDEIQCGLGRTGAWFGFHHSGIRPDIVTIAKGVANGMPVGAVWARDEIAAVFGPGDHGSTYAGQPLALAAARATLAELERIDAPAVALAREAVLRDLLSEVPGIRHVRGTGLLLGVELDDDARQGRSAAEVASACLERGLIVNGVTPTALRLAPPFVVTEDQLAEGVGIIADVLARGAAGTADVLARGAAGTADVLARGAAGTADVLAGSGDGAAGTADVLAGSGDGAAGTADVLAGSGDGAAGTADVLAGSGDGAG